MHMDLQEKIDRLLDLFTHIEKDETTLINDTSADVCRCVYCTDQTPHEGIVFCVESANYLIFMEYELVAQEESLIEALQTYLNIPTPEELEQHEDGIPF